MHYPARIRITWEIGKKMPTYATKRPGRKMPTYYEKSQWIILQNPIPYRNYYLSVHIELLTLILTAAINVHLLFYFIYFISVRDPYPAGIRILASGCVGKPSELSRKFISKITECQLTNFRGIHYSYSIARKFVCNLLYPLPFLLQNVSKSSL